ncbi:glycoside hydrolase family 6 protein [Streptomyces polyrhachis]|uniref:Glucanase n=1 Tax=Streptomyces polyrhachis TaxID=1282885 RepID=A0ABW2GHH8_9ACTN
MYGVLAGRTALAAVSAAMVLTMAGGCSQEDPQSSPTEREGAGQSQKHRRSTGVYWVNPDGSAARQERAFRSAGQAREAKLIARIADRPAAEWLGTDNARGEARGFTQAAAREGKTALLVLYNLPHRDCGQYSRGGAADGDAYRAWLDGVLEGIGKRSATVVVEPDALPHLLQQGCTPAEFHEERYALLKEAVVRLKELPRTKVYLDAGNPGFGPDPGALVAGLRRAGIEQADGFSVNVSNFYTTAASREYGIRLSGLLGGSPHFVIDTSRNGNGPWRGSGDGGDDETWCNPPGRALGEAPTVETGEELVDAYLWIKRPGESDGTCKGGPQAGRWWPQYALQLAGNAG